MPPETSVIIPNYNDAAFVSKAIDSVLAQTCRDFEIVVVDDGSTDESREILKSYSSEVKLVTLDHTGRPGYVRNRGIDIAEGTFLAFLDADDEWKEGKLASQIELIGRENAGMVHSNLDVIDSEGRYLRPFYLDCPGSRGVSDESDDGSFAQLIKGDAGVATPTVLMRRECLKRVGAFEETLPVGEDWHLWIRIARHFRIVFADESLARHRKHTNNTGRRSLPISEVPGVLLWNDILSLYPNIEKDYPEIIRGKFVLHYLLAGLRCMKTGHRRQGARWLLRSLTANPLRMGYRELSRNWRKIRTLRRRQREIADKAGG